MRIAVVDVETTGDEPDDVLVEAAIVILETNRIISKWHSLIHPGSRRISPAASATHHLTKDNFKRGSTYIRLKPTFWENALKDCDYIAAHNASFDRKFLPKNLEIPWICTFRCAQHIFRDAEKYSLQYLRYWRQHKPKIPAGLNPHRALYDALCCAELLQDLLWHQKAEHLASLSIAPLLLTTIRFGKHRGTPWCDLPYDYLHWIIRQDFDEDTKYTAKHYIAIANERRSQSSVSGVRSSNGGAGNPTDEPEVRTENETMQNV